MTHKAAKSTVYDQKGSAAFHVLFGYASQDKKIAKKTCYKLLTQIQQHERPGIAHFDAQAAAAEIPTLVKQPDTGLQH